MSAWEQRKLGELVDVRSGRDYQHLEEGPIPVYGTGGYMTGVNEALSYDEDAIGIGRKGTIDKPYRLFAPFWTVDTLFYAVPRENVNLDFALCLFRNVDWKSKDESTGLPSLSKTIINESDVYVPRNPEQRQIGQLFSRLDALITLHQRKYDKLGELKKSLLEKMFPKEGEVFPEIRFAGFADPWEQRKLGEIADIVSGGTPATGNPTYWDGDINWFAPAEIGDEIYVDSSRRKLTEAGYNACSTTMLPAGRTVLFTSRAGIGSTAILRSSACTNQGFQSLVVRDEASVYFVYSMTPSIKRWAEVHASGSTFLEISGKTLAGMSILIPSLDEQRAIGQFFEQFDALITLHQRKLDHLKLQKKALLQQMFV